VEKYSQVCSGSNTRPKYATLIVWTALRCVDTCKQAVVVYIARMSGLGREPDNHGTNKSLAKK
jgi:hypothetical protein